MDRFFDFDVWKLETFWCINSKKQVRAQFSTGASLSLRFALLIHSTGIDTSSICRISSWVHPRNGFGFVQSRPILVVNISNKRLSSDQHSPMPIYHPIYPNQYRRYSYSYFPSSDVSHIDSNWINPSRRSCVFCESSIHLKYRDSVSIIIMMMMIDVMFVLVVPQRDTYMDMSYNKSNSHRHYYHYDYYYYYYYEYDCVGDDIPMKNIDSDSGSCQSKIKFESQTIYVRISINIYAKIIQCMQHQVEKK